jgi:hypothetical protein
MNLSAEDTREVLSSSSKDTGAVTEVVIFRESSLLEEFTSHHGPMDGGTELIVALSAKNGCIRAISLAD